VQSSSSRGAEGSLGAGWYGSFGGRFVSETLIHALDELTDAAGRIATSDAFQQELRTLL
jgi:tryptophan synthase beta chain